MTTERHELLREHIREVPDFPQPGIRFRDITPLLAEPKAFTTSLDLLAERWAGERVDAVIGIESRGFIFGAALAARLSVSFVPVRKPGKLPSATDRVSYALEYGQDALEIHIDALLGRENVVIVDDLLATGGTASAAVSLCRRRGATVLGASFIIELLALGGRARLDGVPVHALIGYD